jgi:ABC-type Mn2+/Zn2+ transport system permease subunit
MEEENEERYRKRVRKLRRKIMLSVLMGLAAILISLIILSLPNIQAALFPPWLIVKWRVVLAIAAVITIPTIALLPVIIEANFYPKVLSSSDPGRAGILIR